MSHMGDTKYRGRYANLLLGKYFATNCMKIKKLDRGGYRVSLVPSWIRHWKKLRSVTAREQSLGQGNVWSSVCKSFNWWLGGGFCSKQRAPGQRPPCTESPAVLTSSGGTEGGDSHPTRMHTCCKFIPIFEEPLPKAKKKFPRPNKFNSSTEEYNYLRQVGMINSI